MNDHEKDAVWKIDPWGWAGMLLVGVVLSAMFYDGAKELVRIWSEREEYSYGFLIPAISLFLVNLWSY